TPIAGIIGMSEMLAREGISTKDREYGNIIHDTSEHLLSLLNVILAIIASDEMREEHLSLETFSLKERIEHALALFLSNVETQPVKLEIEIDTNLPDYVITDRI